MGLPGGGRTLPTTRLLRHFNLIYIPPFSSENLFRIFSKILESAFTAYPESWKSAINSVTRLSIALYERAVQVLLPLPSKSHYSFNLRQVSELVQGLTLVPSKKVTGVSDDKHQLSLLMRLWVHESLRVFSDRLVNEEDKQVFTQCLKDTVEEDTQQARYLFI